MVAIIKRNIYSIFFIISLVVSIWTILSILIVTLKNNPIEIASDMDYQVFKFVPQGWAFFTRNPREAQIIIYQIKNNNGLIAYPQKHSSYHNIFGLYRKSSKILTELQSIKIKIPDTLYTNSEWNYQTEEYSLLPKEIYSYDNEISEPFLCGEFLIVFQKSIPWAWSKSIKNIKMPSKMVRIKINCK
jgi:antimicrobial peptide system SdpA family protein